MFYLSKTLCYIKTNIAFSPFYQFVLITRLPCYFGVKLVIATVSQHGSFNQLSYINPF